MWYHSWGQVKQRGKIGDPLTAERQFSQVRELSHRVQTHGSASVQTDDLQGTEACQRSEIIDLMPVQIQDTQVRHPRDGSEIPDLPVRNHLCKGRGRGAVLVETDILW